VEGGWRNAGPKHSLRPERRGDLHAWAGGLVASLLGLVDAVIPCGCAICRAAVAADGPPLCGLCASRVAQVPPPLCPRCGLTRVIPVPGPGDCSECHGWPASLRRAASACLHEGSAAELVRGLKYRGWTGLTDYMGQLMLPAARRLGGEARPILVPVPLAPARRRERGFNQAELLAEALSRLTGWTVSPLLQRSRGGPALARLGRQQREQVTAGAYALGPGSADLTRTQIRVLIVDDVITTGATGVACAEALDAGGAECLGIVSFARTNPLAEHT